VSLNPMKGSLASRRSQCYVKRNSSFSQQLFYYSYFRCTTVSVCHSNSSFCQQPVDPSVTAYIAPGYSGDPSPIHTATLSPNWGLATPNQNVIAKRCPIQPWFVLTVYGIIPSPYPTVPLSIEAPLPQKG